MMCVYHWNVLDVCLSLKDSMVIPGLLSQFSADQWVHLAGTQREAGEKGRVWSKQRRAWGKEQGAGLGLTDIS